MPDSIALGKNAQEPLINASLNPSGSTLQGEASATYPGVSENTHGEAGI
jgi:hypothetical protein